MYVYALVSSLLPMGGALGSRWRVADPFSTFQRSTSETARSLEPTPVLLARLDEAYQSLRPLCQLGSHKAPSAACKGVVSDPIRLSIARGRLLRLRTSMLQNSSSLSNHGFLRCSPVGSVVVAMAEAWVRLRRRVLTICAPKSVLGGGSQQAIWAPESVIILVEGFSWRDFLVCTATRDGCGPGNSLNHSVRHHHDTATRI